MDSTVGEDPTLPVNFDESAYYGLPDLTTGHDITAANFHDHFPNASSAENMNPGRMSPSKVHTMKDYEQQISDLKKENFSLKLRIYFMEEKIQQKFEDDDNIKTNIELKVEAESLKKELMEKQQLLFKASQAVESLAQEKENLIKKRSENNNIQMHQLKEQLERRAKLAEQEATSLKHANQEMLSRLNKATKEQQELERALEDKQNQKQNLHDNNRESIAEKDRIIEQLNAALNTKDEHINKLSDEKVHHGEDLVRPLQSEKEQLQRALQIKTNEAEALKKDLDHERRKDEERKDTETSIKDKVTELENQLKDLENENGRLHEDVDEKNRRNKDLENELKIAQRNEKDLSDLVKEKDGEIDEFEENSLKRDKAIQGLVATIKAKDKEMKKLYDRLEDKENALSSARDGIHKAEMKKYEGLDQYQAKIADLESKVADTNADLHAKQLENERLQRSNARKQQEMDRLRNEKLQAEEDIDRITGEKEDAVKNLQNQVQAAKALANNKAGSIEDHYQKLLDDVKKENDKKDKAIKKLTLDLEDKDDVIKDYMELTKDVSLSAKTQERDGEESLRALRDKFKDREKALERKVEEHVGALETAENELANLQEMLKDKEADLEKRQDNDKEGRHKMKELENKLKDSGMKIRQMSEVFNEQARSREMEEDNHKRALGEKDAIIKSLQNAINEKEATVSNLRGVLEGQEKGDNVKDDIIRQLTDKIKEKEKQLQEMVADRAKVADETDKASHELMDMIKNKDEQLKDLNSKLNRLASDQNNKIRVLQRELDNKSYENQGLADNLARTEHDQAQLLGKLRDALAEKDKTIQKLLDSCKEKDQLFLEQAKAKAQVHPAQMEEIANLKAELAGLKRDLKQKENKVKRLQEALPEKGELENLKAELESKNQLLEKARETIDTLKRRPDDDKFEISRLKRRNNDLENELRAQQDQVDALMHANKIKDDVIKDLKKQTTSLNSSDEVDGGSKRRPNNDTEELQNALKDQIRELSRLTDVLRADRNLSVNITQSGNEEDITRSKLLESELAAVQALRRQLELGINFGEGIIINVDGRLRDSSSTSGIYSEKQDLSPSAASQSTEHQCLRPYENKHWSQALHSRLKDLHNKEVQTSKGDEIDGAPLSFVNEPLIIPRQADVSKLTVPELLEEVLDLRDKLAESENQLKTMEEQLERDEIVSLRSIPGQEDDSKAVQSSTALKKEVSSLQDKVRQREQEIEDLHQQLETALLNQSRDGAEANEHVIPILKQQLDQAKTLLREKDAKLQEQEQQNQDLRSCFGLGPNSSIPHGRTYVPSLYQEKTKLEEGFKDLENKVQDYKKQMLELEDEQEKLRKECDEFAKRKAKEQQVVPHMKSQIEKAKILIRRKDKENLALRDRLGIGPKDSIDSGNTLMDHLQASNALLKEQLQDKTNEADELRNENAALLDDLQAVVESPEGNRELEIANLKKQLKTAQNMNDLLKKHISMNTPAGSSSQKFNPELIIDLAREVERLQEELEKLKQEEDEKEEGTRLTDVDYRSSHALRSDQINKDLIDTLQKQLESSQKELRESAQKCLALQRKLKATEGTVHQQAERMQRYRRQLHNAGIGPLGSPKRACSDPNLFKKTVLSKGLQFPSYISDTGDETDVETDVEEGNYQSSWFQGQESLLGASFSEYGQSDDVMELREQVDTLKRQNKRCRTTIQTLQGQISKGRYRSRSASPSRSRNPDGTCTDWSQVESNQEAFGRLQEEVEHLREQLDQANELNFTLHDQYRDIKTQFNASFLSPGKASKDKVREQEKEIAALKLYLGESKKLCDLMKQMLLDALQTMEDIKAARDWLVENVGEEVAEKFDFATEKLRSGANVAETLQNTLAEPKKSTKSSQTKQFEIPALVESLKAKLEEISQLKRSLHSRDTLNQKLRDLLSDNQRVAEETRQDLEKLSHEVTQKNKTITKLHKQVHQLSKTRSSSSGHSSTQGNHQNTSTQTSINGHSTYLPEDTIDISQLYEKLRQNQLLVSALKKELDGYKNVLHSRTPEGSPQVVKSTQPMREGGTDTTLAEYLEELRALRKKLEESMEENDRLREQLQGKLDGAGQNGRITIIHLEETNLKLTETVNSLKTSVTEREQEINSLKTSVTEREQKIQKLKKDLHDLQKNFYRLQAENKHFSEKLEENIELQKSLRFELSVFEQVKANESSGDHTNTSQDFPSIVDPKTGLDLSELFQEMRRLRIQLERSIETNNALRAKMEEMMRDPRWSPSVNSKYTSIQRLTVSKDSEVVINGHDVLTTSSRRKLFANGDELHKEMADFDERPPHASTSDYNDDSSTYEDSSYHPMPGKLHIGSHDNGRSHFKDGENHAIGTLLTYERVKKNIAECRAVIKVVETLLGDDQQSQNQDQSKPNLQSKLRQFLLKASRLVEDTQSCMSKFWTERLPRSEELKRVKRKFAAHQKLLKDTLHQLAEANKRNGDGASTGSKRNSNIEDALIRTLCQHEANLLQAQKNLEDHKMKSSSPPHH